jgi:hypothetical protein
MNARMMLLSFHWRLGAASEDGHVAYEDEAAAVFDEAHAFAEATGQPALKALVLGIYGVLKTQSGAVEEGHQLGVRGTAVADETGDPALRASIRPGIGWTLFVLGRVREATAVTDDMIAIIGDDHSIGRGPVIGSPYAWCHMARAYYRSFIDRLDDGLVATDVAIDIAGREGDRESQAWAHRHWAVIADIAGADAEVAAAHAAQGLQWAEEAGGQWSRIFIREGVATNYAHRGQWADAIGVVDEALAIARDRRMALANIPLLLTIRSRAQLGLGDTVGARSSAEEAVALAVRCGTRAHEAWARTQLSRVMLAGPPLSDERAVAGELRTAFSIVNELGLRALAPQIHVEQGNLFLALGDEAGWQEELREAHRRFLEAGAQGRAVEVAAQLSSAT